VHSLKLRPTESYMILHCPNIICRINTKPTLFREFSPKHALPPHLRPLSLGHITAYVSRWIPAVLRSCNKTSAKSWQTPFRCSKISSNVVSMFVIPLVYVKLVNTYSLHCCAISIIDLSLESIAFKILTTSICFSIFSGYEVLISKYHCLI
jgi:hypothetical protein